MFKTLLIKEWKEKALLAVFGLGVTVAFLAAFLSFGDNPDLRELIPATFLIFFFPFIGVMLGAGAFESEFRNGAWAYLLSRPVRKETIWLAKLTALLSILAAFWLIFIGLMTVVPGLGEVVRGFMFPDILDAGLELFPLILLSSVLYFSAAFSMSILSDRQLSLVFGSLFLGFSLQGLLFYFAFQAEWRGMLSNAGMFPWIDAYKLALVLSSLAFLGASFLTFRRADFSQPKKKAGSLAKYSAVFLVLAWMLAAAWPAVRPGPREELSSGIEISGGEAFFSTSKGLFRYDIAGDKLRKIARWGIEYPGHVIGGGKVVYAASSSEFETPRLRMMNPDGSGKTLLAGGGQNAFPADSYFQGYLISPDGKTVVVSVRKNEVRPRRDPRNSLWSIRSDGTGLKRLPPLPAALDGQGDVSAWLNLHAWDRSSDTLLLSYHRYGGAMGLWTYDLVTGACALLFENPRPFACLVSPFRDVALLIFRREIEGPVEVQLLDISTAERSSVMKLEKLGGSVWFSVWRPAWNREGDKVAFLTGRNGVGATPAVYDMKERRLVRPDIVQVTASEGSSPPSLGWIGGGKLILGVPQEHALRILDLSLAGEKTIPVPAHVEANFAVWPANDVVLLMDLQKDAVWRLDIKTEKWKKIW